MGRDEPLAVASVGAMANASSGANVIPIKEAKERFIVPFIVAGLTSKRNSCIVPRS